MFNFFTALFGGLYYGSKQTYERGKLNAYESSTANKQIIYNRLKAVVGATFQTEDIMKDYILSGNHFEKICNDFKDDLRFVFGEKWKSCLKIPPMCTVNKYDFQLPMNHVYWIYRLMLAAQGKVDSGLLTLGYTIGGIQDKDMCVRFAQRIEQRLLSKGVQGIRLVVEDGGTGDICGCSIKVESLCNHPYRRLW